MKTETCVTFSLPFSWCLHGNAEALSLANKLRITTPVRCGSLLSRLSSRSTWSCRQRKHLRTPAKGTPGTPGKTTAERKEFVWSDDEVQLLLETAASITTPTYNSLCRFWRLHAKSYRFQGIVFKSFHFQQRFQNKNDNTCIFTVFV